MLLIEIQVLYEWNTSRDIAVIIYEQESFALNCLLLTFVGPDP